MYLDAIFQKLHCISYKEIKKGKKDYFSLFWCVVLANNEIFVMCHLFLSVLPQILYQSMFKASQAFQLGFCLKYTNVNLNEV